MGRIKTASPSANTAGRHGVTTMMLSPNFSLAELTISEFAAHMEIDNTPGPAVQIGQRP